MSLCEDGPVSDDTVLGLERGRRYTFDSGIVFVDEMALYQLDSKTRFPYTSTADNNELIFSQKLYPQWFLSIHDSSQDTTVMRRKDHPLWKPSRPVQLLCKTRCKTGVFATVLTRCPISDCRCSADGSKQINVDGNLRAPVAKSYAEESRCNGC